MAQDGEPPVDFSSTDEETLLVTVRSMRNALWYYENYFIQRDLSESKDSVIDGLDQLVTQWEVAHTTAVERALIAEGKLSNWITFGFTTGVITALLLTLEFLNALPKPDSGT